MCVPERRGEVPPIGTDSEDLITGVCVRGVEGYCQEERTGVGGGVLPRVEHRKGVAGRIESRAEVLPIGPDS